ncbi:nucleolar GTP-binding protein 2 [Phakopsora pachyrhizi]|uniref:Nucleolar GTP-binding protein 2 n=1 Tax=Phakopsora pachyrhizi TaxID=170000 RepID=A0AAV0ARS8_PHAPC|nr:nucleolar GTP-binding protein 2 [Phakopsora pachyrhizi]
MPKIRKKTSNRMSTRMRERIKHKVKESHKKAKKDAKKDVTWKSRVKKDPGIPSLFPYKEQLLAEQQQAKIQNADVKKQSAQASVLALAQQISADPTSGVMDLDDKHSSDEIEDDEGVTNDPSLSSSSSIKAHARSLQKVLELSDVLIEVLDARDPIGTRSFQLERDSTRQGKKLILNVEAWLKYLRRSWPTLPFKSSTQSQRQNLSSRKTELASRESGSNSNASSIQPLMHLLKNYSRYSSNYSESEPSSSSKPQEGVHTIKSLASITVGVIGFPNVGKSSLINTLKRSKACGVAPTPGFTKEVKEIALEKGLKILDCPGVVLESSNQRNADPRLSASLVLRNATKVEQITDPLTPVSLILERCKPEHLMLLYNIPTFNFPGQTDESRMKEFLIQVARSRGRIRKGGIPDLEGSARGVLRDWNMGRIPYYTVPPELPKQNTLSDSVTCSTDVGQSKIVKEFAEEFDLESIFRSADSEALGELKRKRKVKIDIQPTIISMSPSKISKRSKTADQPERGGASKTKQLEAMGIDMDLFVAQNKQISRQAKKDRKKSDKQLRKLDQEHDSKADKDEVEMADAEDDRVEGQPLPSNVEDQTYSFADFFLKNS